MGMCWGHLGSFWGRFGSSGARLKTFWGSQGASWGRVGAVLSWTGAEQNRQKPQGVSNMSFLEGLLVPAWGCLGSPSSHAGKILGLPCGRVRSFGRRLDLFWGDTSAGKEKAEAMVEACARPVEGRP